MICLVVDDEMCEMISCWWCNIMKWLVLDDIMYVVIGSWWCNEAYWPVWALLLFSFFNAESFSLTFHNILTYLRSYLLAYLLSWRYRSQLCVHQLLTTTTLPLRRRVSSASPRIPSTNWKKNRYPTLLSRGYF